MIPVPESTLGDTAWFTHDRFGMFIHWGLYALAARHEWVKQVEQIPDVVYDQYLKHFDPDLYDPDLWAKAAADAGMKYFVITTKHHEGYCLWDSKLTDYKCTNTPYGKDLLHPMVDAFRGQNMNVGFYHSLIDWHHPEFPIDTIHSQRRNPDALEINRGRDIRKYAEYLHGQVRELLTEFGKIDIMWFDFSYPDATWTESVVDGIPRLGGKGKDDWQSDKLLKMIRELQPHVILDDRLDLPYGWDVKTPEQYQPREWIRVNGKPVVWEACQTFSGSWGYHRDEESWKSVDQLVQMLIDSVSKGGNLLLNVGPTGRGEFDERALSRLSAMGEWMSRHSRSIYGCTQAPDGFACPPDCRFTYNPTTNRLYLHLFAWPFRHVHLDGFGDRIEYAQLLNDASEVKMLKSIPEAGYGAMKESRGAESVTLELPVKKPNVTVPVVEMYLK